MTGAVLKNLYHPKSRLKSSRQNRPSLSRLLGRPERDSVTSAQSDRARRELLVLDSRGCIVASVTNLTPFERHRLDRSHYGTICSRCGYLRCAQCGVECRCHAEVRRLTLFAQGALIEAFSLIADSEVASSQVRVNAGRTSLTVVLKAPDGTVKMFRLDIEAI